MPFAKPVAHHPRVSAYRKKARSACAATETDLRFHPLTPFMPWNYKNRNLLTAKALKVGRVGKNRENRRVLLPKCYQNACYQFATKLIRAEG
jgi:hypothetical protein